MEIAKSGWLHRQSSVLRRWKRSWFVLYQSGDLAYFETPDSFNPEEKVVVRAVCIGVRPAEKCDFSPPEGKSKWCLLQLEMRSGHDDWKLCAESPDDMKAWQIAVDEARVMNHGTRPGPSQLPQGAQVVYPQQMFHQHYAYPGQVLRTNPGQYMVHDAATGRHMMVSSAPGSSNVVYMQEPTYYNRGYTRPYLGGTMVYGPCLWW